jgi:hypothetical protein
MEQRSIKPRAWKPQDSRDLILASNTTFGYLIGSPGFRTKWGKTGLDPLDSEMEMAYMQGVIARLLLTGRFRTRNAFYLLIMLAIGLIGISPLVLSLICIISSGEWWTLQAVAFFALHIILGIAVLANAGLSILGAGHRVLATEVYNRPEYSLGARPSRAAIASLLVLVLVATALSRIYRPFIFVDESIVRIDFRILLFIILFGHLIQIPAFSSREQSA